MCALVGSVYIFACISHTQAVADLLKSNAQERVSGAFIEKLQDELKAAEDNVKAQRGLLATSEQVKDGMV
jgi:hypothetical protein